MNKYDFLLLDAKPDEQGNFTLKIPSKALKSILYYFDYVGEGLEEEDRQIRIHESKNTPLTDALLEYKKNLQDMQKIHNWITAMLFKIGDPLVDSKEQN
jgi:hypothetical protein